MSNLNTLVYQFLEKAAPSSAKAFKKTASNIADAPATPTLTELVNRRLAFLSSSRSNDASNASDSSSSSSDSDSSSDGEKPDAAAAATKDDSSSDSESDSDSDSSSSSSSGAKSVVAKKDVSSSEEKSAELRSNDLAVPAAKRARIEEAAGAEQFSGGATTAKKKSAPSTGVPAQGESAPTAVVPVIEEEEEEEFAGAPAPPTLTELGEHHLKRGRDGGDTSSAAAAERVKQASNSDSGSSGVPAQGGVALTDLEKAQKTVDSLEEREKELRKLMGVVGDIHNNSHQITDVALKRRLQACGIVHFKNVPKVLKQLRAVLTSVNKQLETARPDLAEVRKQTAGELAERYKPVLREGKTLAKTAYRGAEEAKKAVMPYIKGALRIGTAADERMAWLKVDDKDQVRIFATVGQMGKGKTRLQYELCKQEAIKTDFGDTHVNFVRLTYNEGFSAFPGETEDIFGQNLLMCTGMDREDAQRVRSFEEAVDLLYRKLSWPSDKARALVVCVDEFLTLPAACRNPDKARADLLKWLLWFQQDSCEREGVNRVVFLFAAVTREMLKQAQTVSGRELRVGNVPTLSKEDALSMLFELRSDLRNRYRTDTQFELLVHLCLPRPRALFNGLLNAYHDNLMPSESVSMARALDEIAQSNSLLSALDYVVVDDVRLWLTSMSLHGDDKHKEMQKQWGVTADESLDPLTLRYWCESKTRKVTGPEGVARYLHEAYMADTKVEEPFEKAVEEVLYNFEAAKRAAYNNKPFKLSEYYKGGTIKSRLKGKSVFAFPGPVPKELVNTVATFTDKEGKKYKDKTKTFKRLKDGCVVVSTKTNEAAIEYLVPFFAPKLKYVAAVQVKFSPSNTIGGGYQEICDKAMKLPIVKFLQDKNVTCFPVLFSTSHGNMPKSAGEVERGVLYNETAMLEFTECLGPLRLQREKASEGQIGKVREIHAGQSMCCSGMSV